MNYLEKAQEFELKKKKIVLPSELEELTIAILRREISLSAATKAVYEEDAKGGYITAFKSKLFNVIISLCDSGRITIN